MLQRHAAFEPLVIIITNFTDCDLVQRAHSLAALGIVCTGEAIDWFFLSLGAWNLLHLVELLPIKL